MDAVPEDSKQSRKQQLKGSGFLNIEPDTRALWLINIAFECGLYQSSGMGLQPVGWVDINNYMIATGRKWTWLSKVIRRLSLDYLNEYHAAKEPGKASPFQELLDVEVNRDNVKRQLKNFIKAKKRYD